MEMQRLKDELKAAGFNVCNLNCSTEEIVERKGLFRRKKVVALVHAHECMIYVNKIDKRQNMHLSSVLYKLRQRGIQMITSNVKDKSFGFGFLVFTAKVIEKK